MLGFGIPIGFSFSRFETLKLESSRDNKGERLFIVYNNTGKYRYFNSPLPAAHLSV
jgi:hypothetical protein